MEQEYDRELRETPLQALAEKYRFVPVGLLGADGQPRPFTPAEPLKLDDRLTLVIAFEDLQLLLDREGTVV